MAMNVSFKKGLKASLPSTRDANTFYYVSDEFALYLGNHLISNEVTLEQFEALAARVKNLEDWKATLTELTKDNGTADLIKVSVTTENGAVKTVAVDDSALDTKLENDLKAAKDYTDQEINKITTGAGYATTKYVDDAIGALDANVTSTAPETGKGIQVGVTEVDGVITAVTVSGNYDEAYDAKGAASTAEENAKKYTDDEITGLEFNLSEDGKTLELKNKAGTAVATLNTTDFVVDGMLSSVVADQTNNKLTFTWNTDAGETVTEIELSSIADIYKGSEGTEVKVSVSNENIISAELTAAIRAEINKGVDAQTRVGVIEGKEATWDGKQDALTTTQLAAVNSGITTEKVGQYDAAVSTVNGLGDLAAKNEADLNLGQYAKTADISADIAKGVAANTAITDGTSGLAAAHTKAQQGIDDAAAALAKANEKATLDEAKTAIQGNTTVKVEDCVKAINKLVDGSETTGTQINTINNNVAEIIEALTWGNF